jgi:hypothetical protein
MKFITAFTAFTVALTATATPVLESRQVVSTDPSGKLLDVITGHLGEMAKAIGKFNGDPLDAIPILDASNAILKSMKDGATTITDGKTMGITDTIAILAPLTSLNSAVGDVTKGLIRKKAQFEKADLLDIVLDQLETFTVVSNDLVKTITSRLPAMLPKTVAEPFSQPILDKLNEVIKVFKTKKPA